MAVAMALTVAQTFFAALQCKELRMISSMCGYGKDLDEVQQTASTIKALLLDADSKLHGVLSHEARDWVDKLKDAVYDVDDLLDEFNTIVQRNKLQEETDGGKVIKKIARKVRRFFSRSNQLVTAFNTSLDVKKIKKKLDAIASDHSKFGFSVNYEPIRRVRKETLSCVDKDRIFGREDDKEAVVSRLLQDHSSSTQKNVSFVSIVGMGGLGKTALAQLVYNDDRIRKRFDLRLWVCVSDEFGVKEILVKMLKSVCDKNWNHLGIDQLHRKVREQLERKNFLLVLDDVWCENRNDWVDLNDIFIYGERGSRILVTTRSYLVANAAGSDVPYDLKGLSPEDSWDLFVHMAFVNGGEQADAELVEIGREIVKNCTNVPLSIRVIASMLYRQDLQKWKSFAAGELSKIRRDEDVTMTILKFSYDHLTSSLKTCFGYCALFPKDYEIKKELLINLWSAHGCLEPRYEGQRIEEVGEEYFSILLSRCFFQEIGKHYLGDVIMVHDLVHDLAQQVTGKEMLSWSGGYLKWKLRHLSVPLECLDDLFNQVEVVSQVKMIRTFLALASPYPTGLVNTSNAPLVISNCRYLRVLHLCKSDVKILPSTIGELVHLRYLDLSHNKYLEMLPESTMKLHNLQVMILASCEKLKALPKNLSKLVNLRVLDTDRCFELTHMPGGMKKLTRLERLTRFVVGKTKSEQMKVSNLDDLKAFVQLSDNLRIELGEYLMEVPSEVTRGRCYPLVNSRLKNLEIEFPVCLGDEDAQLMLECLRPNSDLKEIKISRYGCSNFPRWGSQGNSLSTLLLPSLVVIELRGLCKLRSLPSMRRLDHLKYLVLDKMDNLEYMEEGNGDGSSADELKFFPCLEKLILKRMGKLKGWWRPNMNIDDEGATSSFSRFPCLRMLQITGCPELISFPSCPHLQCMHRFEDADILLDLDSKIVHKELATDRICGYKYFKDEEFANGLVNLTFKQSKEESMCSRIETVNFFKICGSSLQTLEISFCKKLKRVGKGVFEHLTNLQSLKIEWCDNLSFEEDDEEGMMSWKSLESLSSLELSWLRKMIKLPKGIQYLSSLRTLIILGCNELKTVGKGEFEHLTNLRSLAIWLCHNLTFEEDNEEEEGMTSWKSLQSLSSLELFGVDKMVKLPKGIQYLTSLQALDIRHCDNLSSLPEAIRYLPSLTCLDIIKCPGLTTRCRGPNGEDWPIIKHIPSLYIME